jgi:hypothetical protein
MNEENKKNENIDTDMEDNQISENTTKQKTTYGESIYETQNNQKGENSYGPIVGIAIIVIVLIIGGIYLWFTAIERIEDEPQLPTIQSGGETDAIVNELNSQSTSDELLEIEADLYATDLESLDTEIEDILNEL